MRILERNSSLLIGVVDSLLAAAWTGRDPSAAEVATALEVCANAAMGGRWGLLVCAPANCPLPSEAVRATIEKGMKKLDPYIVVGATVIERGGFLGSAMRALVSTLQLLVRPQHPERTFASCEPAAAYLHAELTKSQVVAPSVVTMIDAYHQLMKEAQSR